ncbi:hypothetical protein CTAYLR_006083 [Chrysophaeum taylorii]|uniref:non-specific serine/threonine protein kinase n=1 Tax=Chrysophaeum taylorii TaxID=2483200 RepID=A0AAD7UJD0_9STRA|nr:hypothetical protein CTAYLR_006083 [Chrysophaeum taylorii]
MAHYYFVDDDALFEESGGVGFVESSSLSCAPSATPRVRIAGDDDEASPRILKNDEGKFYYMSPVLGQDASGFDYHQGISSNGTTICVKIVTSDRESQCKLVAEARLVSKLARLPHENIVTYSCAKIDQAAGLMLVSHEWIDPTHSLASHVETFGGKLPDAATRAYAEAIGNGLEHLHGHQIVHNDLNSQTVLVSESGVAKLVLTPFAQQQGSVVAKALDRLCYVAPEVMKQGTSQRKAADVWSYGSLLHFMVTGEAPWEALQFPSSAKLRLHVLLVQSPPPLDHISPPILSLIQACLCYDEERRPSIAELMKDPFITAKQERGAFSKQNSSRRRAAWTGFACVAIGSLFASRQRLGRDPVIPAPYSEKRPPPPQAPRKFEMCQHQQQQQKQQQQQQQLEAAVERAEINARVPRRLNRAREHHEITAGSRQIAASRRRRPRFGRRRSRLRESDTFAASPEQVAASHLSRSAR